MRVLVIVVIVVIVVVIVTWESKANSSSSVTELQTGTELGKILFEQLSLGLMFIWAFTILGKCCNTIPVYFVLNKVKEKLPLTNPTPLITVK